MDRDGAMIVLEETVLGRPVHAQIQRLDEGFHVLVTGGDRTHIGAYTLAEPCLAPETRVLPGHKDQFISEPWASAIASASGERTLVVCGIHYDGIGPAEIRTILDAADRMLKELLHILS